MHTICCPLHKGWLEFADEGDSGEFGLDMTAPPPPAWTSVLWSMLRFLEYQGQFLL